MQGTVLRREWKNKKGQLVKAKTWAIRFYDGVEKKHRWKGGFKTRLEAERALAEISTKVHRGDYFEIKQIGFSEFAQKWLSDHAEPRVKYSTLKGYKDNVNIHLTPYFANTRLSNITPRDIDAYISTKRQEDRLSNKTIGYHVTLIKMMFKTAMIWEHTSRNPCEHIKKPRAEHKEIEFLTPEEIRLLLDYVEAKHYPLILTLATTGLRIGEALALRWGDIAFANSTLHVRRSVTRGRVSEPKSSHSIRAVAMPPILVKTLKLHKLRCTPSENDYCFPSSNGTPMNSNNIYNRVLLPALRRAGLRHVCLHSLRHSYASILIAQGENLKFVQSQLGHSSIQVTVDRYGHLLPETRNDAATRLESTIFGPRVEEKSVIL